MRIENIRVVIEAASSRNCSTELLKSIVRISMSSCVEAAREALQCGGGQSHTDNLFHWLVLMKDTLYCFEIQKPVTL